MFDLSALILDGATTAGTVLAGAASLLYAGTVAAVTLLALLGRTPARRRNARDVLAILLRRHPD
jgi:hypothetical protein